MNVNCNRDNIVFAAVILALLTFVIYPTLHLYFYSSNLYLNALMTIFRLSLFFVVFHAIGYWFYRSLTYGKDSSISPPSSVEHTQPNVVILIPIRDEPIQLIRRMFLSLKEINYPNVELIAIDNSTSQQVDLFYDIANDIGLSISVIRKSDNTGFKAGALNKALETLEAEIEYVLILDIDHAPLPDILERLVPELNKDVSAAFIQAPQRYDDSSPSLIAGAFCYRQRIFYDHICPGLSINGSLFFSGTNALFRKKALDDTGGFDETSLTEDLRTSVNLHEKSWRGNYYPHHVSLGLPPTDLHTYHRQQRRWAIGTYQNLFSVLNKIIHNQSSLTLSQRMLYLGWNGTYYLQGFASIILISCSVVFLYLGHRDLFSWSDMLVFPIFFITLLSTMRHERKVTNVKWINLLIYKSLMFGDALIHMTAFIDYVTSRNLIFEVTKKSPNNKAERASPIFFIYHTVLILFIGFGIITSFFVAPFNGPIMIWPLIFLIQALTVLISTRYGILEGTN